MNEHYITYNDDCGGHDCVCGAEAWPVYSEDGDVYQTESGAVLYGSECGTTGWSGL